MWRLWTGHLFLLGNPNVIKSLPYQSGIQLPHPPAPRGLSMLFFTWKLFRANWTFKVNFSKSYDLSHPLPLGSLLAYDMQSKKKNAIVAECGFFEYFDPEALSPNFGLTSEFERGKKIDRIWPIIFLTILPMAVYFWLHSKWPILCNQKIFGRFWLFYFWLHFRIYFFWLHSEGLWIFLIVRK